MQLENALKLQLSFFKETPLRENIKENGKVSQIPADTVILEEGKYVKYIPILLSGSIKVVKWEGGKEILLYYINPLESCIVSIHCGLNDVKSNVKAITEDDSEVLLVPSGLINDWQLNYASFNTFILNLYQKRFEDVLDAFNAMAFQRLDKRIVSYLEAKREAKGVNTLKATHQDLADELGTSRETVSRILKKLEVEQVVKLHRGSIELL